MDSDDDDTGEGKESEAEESKVCCKIDSIILFEVNLDCLGSFSDDPQGSPAVREKPAWKACPGPSAPQQDQGEKGVRNTGKEGATTKNTEAVHKINKKDKQHKFLAVLCSPAFFVMLPA